MPRAASSEQRACGTRDHAAHHGVERAADRPWMSRYHACWSVGSIVGAALGALAAWAGIGVTAQFVVVAALVAIGVLLALRT